MLLYIISKTRTHIRAMSQNLLIFAAAELFIFCLLLYFIIRVNIYVNTLQKEVNELHMYLPVALRDIKSDLKAFNVTLMKKFEAQELTPQELGLLFGRIFSDIIFMRFSVSPFTKKMTLAQIALKLWNIRGRLKQTFLKNLILEN